MSPVNCLAGSKDLKRWFWGEKNCVLRGLRIARLKLVCAGVT